VARPVSPEHLLAAAGRAAEVETLKLRLLLPLPYRPPSYLEPRQSRRFHREHRSDSSKRFYQLKDPANWAAATAAAAVLDDPLHLTMYCDHCILDVLQNLDQNRCQEAASVLCGGKHLLRAGGVQTGLVTERPPPRQQQLPLFHRQHQQVRLSQNLQSTPTSLVTCLYCAHFAADVPRLTLVYPQEGFEAAGIRLVKLHLSGVHPQHCEQSNRLVEMMYCLQGLEWAVLGNHWEMACDPFDYRQNILRIQEIPACEKCHPDQHDGNQSAIAAANPHPVEEDPRFQNRH